MSSKTILYTFVAAPRHTRTRPPLHSSLQQQSVTMIFPRIAVRALARHRGSFSAATATPTTALRSASTMLSTASMTTTMTRTPKMTTTMTKMTKMMAPFAYTPFSTAAVDSTISNPDMFCRQVRITTKKQRRKPNSCG